MELRRPPDRTPHGYLHFVQSRLREYEVCEWLSDLGLPTAMPDKCTHPYDIWCNGWRVEVKGAVLGATGKYWTFTICNGRPTDEKKRDFYVLVPRAEFLHRGKLHIVLPSPTGQMGIGLNIKQLPNWLHYVNWTSPLAYKGPHKRPESNVDHAARKAYFESQAAELSEVSA